MKNIYDLVNNFIGILICDEYRDPEFQRVRAWCEAIDAIKPDWSKAPEWANWWAVCASGTAYWSEDEPDLYVLDWFARGKRASDTYVALPDGCDWRVMCFQRPPQV